MIQSGRPGLPESRKNIHEGIGIGINSQSQYMNQAILAIGNAELNAFDKGDAQSIGFSLRFIKAADAVVIGYGNSL